MLLTCTDQFLQSKEVLAKAKKFSAKFNAFLVHLSLLRPKFDLNSSLQVEH